MTHTQKILMPIVSVMMCLSIVIAVWTGHLVLATEENTSNGNPPSQQSENGGSGENGGEASGENPSSGSGEESRPGGTPPDGENPAPSEPDGGDGENGTEPDGGENPDEFNPNPDESGGENTIDDEEEDSEDAKEPDEGEEDSEDAKEPDEEEEDSEGEEDKDPDEEDGLEEEGDLEEIPEEPEEEEEEEELPEIELFGLLNVHERVVFDSDELEKALQDPVISVIYLGDNITVSKGLEINPNRSSLVIDGNSPIDSGFKRYSLTEFSSSAQIQAIYLNDNTGLKSITLRNMIIYGKNHYGTVTVANTVSDVLLSYENVDYYGPQLTYNRYGTGRYANCNIQIGSFDGPSAPGEVGEVSSVILEGAVNITQVQGQANEIFFIEAKAGSIQVMPGAVVNISAYSESGFLYKSVPVTFTVHENAVFNFKSPWRFQENTPLNGVIINGEAYIEITGTSQETVMRINGDLVVGENAVLHILNRSSGPHTALYMPSGSVQFNNPKSVVLYSPNRRAIQYGVANTLSITAEQVNYWTTAGSGGFEDLPLYAWKKKNGTDLSILGTLAAGDSGNFTDISSNFDPQVDISAPVAPDANSFNMPSARVISIGRLPLTSMYILMAGEKSRISGRTESNAAIGASYVDPEEEFTNLGSNYQAGADGYYRMDLAGIIPEGSLLTVKSAWNYLFSELTYKITHSNLMFLTYPQDIHFGLHKLESQTLLLPRQGEDWSVAVKDMREAGSRWRLTATLTTPLTAGENGEEIPALADTLVYVDGNGTLEPLLVNNAVLIYDRTTTADQEDTVITWGSHYGILANVNPGAVRTGVEYNAVIQWALEDIP